MMILFMFVLLTILKQLMLVRMMLIFYAYQPPPPLNDVAFDAYQPDDIAITAYQA